jgi:hypothetical protein
MALQLREADVQNNMLNAIDTEIGTAGSFRIYSGAQPATCSTANSGTELAYFTLPNPAFNAAASGQMTKNGTWQEDSALADGTAGHFRIYNNVTPGDGTSTTMMQGSCGIGTGDLQFDNTDIATGQVVTVSTFTLIAGNDS